MIMSQIKCQSEVSVCVCEYVCACVHSCVRTCVCMGAHVCMACVCVCMCVACLCVCMCVACLCVHVCVSNHDYEEVDKMALDLCKKHDCDVVNCGTPLI